MVALVNVGSDEHIYLLNKTLLIKKAVGQIWLMGHSLSTPTIEDWLNDFAVKIYGGKKSGEWLEIGKWEGWGYCKNRTRVNVMGM